jgi:probable F420-dependent oxidoreductase
VDELGFEFVGCGDHLGRRAPFSFLTAAAAASDRLRLRTYVLNVGFWNPALLAREAATVDRVTDGRLELGLGAGTIRSEFEQAGLPWRPASERIVRMEQTVELVRHLLGDSSHEPQPVQRPIPILIGTMSMRGLTIAAEHADIVAFAAIRQAEGKPPGVLRSATAQETDELVAHARQCANGRSFESDVLLQVVELGRDPLRAAKAFVEREGDEEDPRVLAESPCALFARTAADAAAELERRRDQWGFTSFTTFWPSADALAQARRELA